MTDTKLDLQLRTDHLHIQTNTETVMHVMADLVAPAGVEAVRPPLAVVLVLDVSTSMDGEPLEHVKVATRRLLDVLGPDDRAGIVAFSTDAELIAPVRSRDRDARKELGRAVRALRSRGTTNIQAGLKLGREILPERPIRS